MHKYFVYNDVEIQIQRDLEQDKLSLLSFVFHICFGSFYFLMIGESTKVPLQYTTLVFNECNGPKNLKYLQARV